MQEVVGAAGVVGGVSGGVYIGGVQGLPARCPPPPSPPLSPHHMPRHRVGSTPWAPPGPLATAAAAPTALTPHLSCPPPPPSATLVTVWSAPQLLLPLRQRRLHPGL